MPAAAADAIRRASLDTPRALRLVAARYSANAYPFSLLYQNCNQWVAEMIAAGWGGLADGDDLRERAQRWLRESRYSPEPVAVGSRLLMFAASFIPFLHLDDHPDADRDAMRLQVSLPTALEGFVRSASPAASASRCAMTSAAWWCIAADAGRRRLRAGRGRPRRVAGVAAMHKGVLYALLAAALFGASTPFAKTLVGQVAPVGLAGMLYLGSGLGLLACIAVRAMAGSDKPAGLKKTDLPWLAGAIAAGGIAGPVLLMIGLSLTAASTASLLLNMEGVLTSMLAWFVFRENFDRASSSACCSSWRPARCCRGTRRRRWACRGARWPSPAPACAGASTTTSRARCRPATRCRSPARRASAGVVNLAIAFALGFRLPAPGTVLAAGTLVGSAAMASAW